MQRRRSGTNLSASLSLGSLVDYDSTSSSGEESTSGPSVQLLPSLVPAPPSNSLHPKGPDKLPKISQQRPGGRNEDTDDGVRPRLA